jgi:hypothetical protein
MKGRPQEGRLDARADLPISIGHGRKLIMCCSSLDGCENSHSNANYARRSSSARCRKLRVALVLPFRVIRRRHNVSPYWVIPRRHGRAYMSSR